jgi:serine phosphatase RsbU (regulator of sigma subunit)/ketosteroid isomerase-like protein
MPSEEKKALVRRFYEAHLKGDLDAMLGMMAPDFVDRSLFPGEEGSDREAYIQGISEDQAAISITRFTIEDQIAESDKVVTRYTERSIHRSEFLGVAPTGKEVFSTGIDIHRIAGDKIAEEWSEANNINIVVPALEQEIQKRERIEQELRVARRIQQASLPKAVPELGGWDISPQYRPAREVGGDFYDFHLLPGGRLGLVVGDATGKGVPAALVMSTTCGMLRLAAQSYSSPGEMLQRVNEALFPNIPPNMFVTCFYSILEPDSGRLVFANAGHPLPFMRRGGYAEELRARGMPLGLMPGMDYEEKEIVLEAGEAALFYSDGLVESHDSKGEMFGSLRLQALIAEHGDEGRSLGDYLLERLYSFTGEVWEQEDDITLLTLRRSASRSRPS